MGLVLGKKILYVCDRHVIAAVNLSERKNESWSVAEISGNSAYGFSNGNGKSARFFEPRFVAIDSTTNILYISDVLNYALRIVALNTSQYITTTYCSFSGKETNGIALSNENKFLFAAATALNGLWKIPIQEGPVPSSLFDFITNPSHAKGQLVDGALNSSLWYRPGSLTIDRADNLYVMDSWDSISRLSSSTSNMYFNYAIRRVSTSLGRVTTMAGKYCSYLGASNSLSNPSEICYSDGNGTAAGLSKVKSMSVSSYLAVGSLGDKLYFTDYGNSVIRKLNCRLPSRSTVMHFGECVCIA
jgi:hypothetical protein